MKKYMIAMLATMFITGCSDSLYAGIPAHTGANNQTIAIYVIMDGSGSMASNDKWKTANSALIGLGEKIDKYLKDNATKNVLAGIVLFNDGKISVTDFGVVSNNIAQKYQRWIKANGNKSPEGGTPIGRSIETAASYFKNDNVKSKHIMVITDGDNTAGPTPYKSITLLKEDKNNVFSTYFIAFDINASVFNSVKELGCKVFSASNGKELEKQINTIVKEEILLEKED